MEDLERQLRAQNVIAQAIGSHEELLNRAGTPLVHYCKGIIYSFNRKFLSTVLVITGMQRATPKLTIFK